jgi:hypothetical protein
LVKISRQPGNGWVSASVVVPLAPLETQSHPLVWLLAGLALSAWLATVTDVPLPSPLPSPEMPPWDIRYLLL